jgi:hypothetical protein
MPDNFSLAATHFDHFVDVNKMIAYLFYALIEITLFLVLFLLPDLSFS